METGTIPFVTTLILFSSNGAKSIEVIEIRDTIPAGYSFSLLAVRNRHAQLFKHETLLEDIT
jgi:hypothetical protein